MAQSLLQDLEGEVRCWIVETRAISGLALKAVANLSLVRAYSLAADALRRASITSSVDCIISETVSRGDGDGFL